MEEGASKKIGEGEEECVVLLEDGENRFGRLKLNQRGNVAGDLERSRNKFIDGKGLLAGKEGYANDSSDGGVRKGYVVCVCGEELGFRLDEGLEVGGVRLAADVVELRA